MTPAQAWLDVGLVLWTTVLAVYAPTILMASSASGEPTVPGDLPLVAIKWFEATIVAGLAGYLLLRHRMQPAALGFRLQGIGWQVAWGVGGLVAAYLYMALSTLAITRVAPYLPGLEQDMQRRLDFVSQMPVQNMGSTVALLIAVAFHEELLFRGLLLTLMRRGAGSWTVAVLLSTGMFSLLHFPQGWLAMIQVAGLSLIFSWIRIGSRSLPAVMITHFGFDFLKFQLLRWALPYLQNGSQNLV